MQGTNIFKSENERNFDIPEEIFFLIIFMVKNVNYTKLIILLSGIESLINWES